MDWLKLFTLLVAVASIPIRADGPKKKIRIHLPQKVKHIHHHKKIYITNHPAPSQYAPAYLPNTEGTVAVPNVALPGMANLVPLNSVELYEESTGRVPGISPAATHLLPLYHARGYYGPTHTEIEEQEYDVVPSQDSEESYGPSSYSSPAAAPPKRAPKRMKIIKINESPRKKVVRKGKPKRVVVRNKPHPPPPIEEEHPVSTYHEQFYSDVDGSRTIRKIKKPPRVEKIVDGDTEHIHEYSEEHIHKMRYDDAANVPNLIAVDPLTGIPAIPAPQHMIPFKNGQTILALAANPYAGLPAVAPMPFEYAAYNPREVTHDHIFHDHGEISGDGEINKESIGLPPKVSYNSQGLRVTGIPTRQKSKLSQKNKKPLKPDLSYYEGIYAPIKPKKIQKPKLPVNPYETSDELNFRHTPDYGFRENSVKPRNPSVAYYGKSPIDYGIQHSSEPAPFSVSSTIVHDYKPKTYAGAGSAGNIPNLKSQFGNTYANNFDYDPYASSSSFHTSEDKNDYGYETQKRGKKKSISTQNISFGGKDHISIIDHLQNSKYGDNGYTEEPTALDNIDQFEGNTKLSDIITPSPFTLKESSPAHQYYSEMALKAFEEDPLSMPEASNDNFEYVEAPSPSTTQVVPSVATLHSAQFLIKKFETTTLPNTEYVMDSRPNKKEKEAKISNTNKKEHEKHDLKDTMSTLIDFRAKSTHLENTHSRDQETTTVRNKLKYGDKI